MGLFGNIFGGSDNEDNGVEWSVLNSLEQIDTIIEESANVPVVIFKHSTRCSISSSALNRFERGWDSNEAGELKPYFLDLISFRDVSNALARKLNVEHQSPQIIVLKNKKAVFNTSHMSINFDDLKQYV